MTTRLNHVADLQSLDEDRLGEQLSVIWELEVGQTVTPPQGLPEHINPAGATTPSPWLVSSTRCVGVQ